MTKPLLHTSDLSKAFGALRANDGVGLSVMPGTIHALIGPNGAGKSTLVSLLAGEQIPDRGHIKLMGRDITALPAYKRARMGLKRSYQITSLFLEFTVLENAMIAVQAQEPHAFRFIADARRDPGLANAALEILDRLGLADQAHNLVANLSHGVRRQLELAMVLAGAPKIILLDEPMAGMGRGESAVMTETIREMRQQCGVLLVEHDMDVVFALADTITVLVKGEVIASGTPDAIRADADVQAAYLGND